MVRGNLYWRDLGQATEAQDTRHRFMVTQHFEYVNTLAYESASQTFGLGVLSRWELGQPAGWSLFTVGEGLLSPMSAVSSDFAFLAEVPGVREDFRDYDFGLSGGGRLGASLIRGSDRIVDLYYSAVYMSTLNGSVRNGSDASHVLQTGLARLVVPVAEAWDVGIDYEVFLRDSNYSLDLLEDTVQRSPQLRAFVSWKLGDTGPAGIGR
ncbi:MAG: hypothetical protein P8177_13325 [Gemmatimonadota bacterium]